MRHILTSVVLLVLLFPALASGETMDDLVERDGIHYKKYTDVPFTGKTTGKEQGTFKNGVRDGPWVDYHDNGQLYSKGTYQDDERDGPWVNYWYNGQLLSKGTYENGKKDGPWVSYWENGQLWSHGTHEDGKMDGPWVWYNKDGTGIESLTGTYNKDGVKISD